MIQINKEDIAQKYNSIKSIWPKSDHWHYWTYTRIFLYLKKQITDSKDTIVLNAGSSGNDYGFKSNNMYHLDIASEKIKNCINPIVSSIEQIPIQDNFFDLVICVGSVINYCDPIPSILEFSRVLKKGGRIILEYESSKTLELLGSKDLNKLSVLRKTFYNNTDEIIFYYSNDYIFSLLKKGGFEIVHSMKFHIISALIYRITKNENFSAKFSKLDKIASKLPFLKHYSSNVILTAVLK